MNRVESMTSIVELDLAKDSIEVCCTHLDKWLLSVIDKVDKRNERMCRIVDVKEKLCEAYDMIKELGER